MVFTSKKNRLMPDYYQENFKDYYQRTFQIDSSNFLDSFIQHITIGSLVLDVGCGSGRDLLWLKKKGYQAIGFERSTGLAALARKSTGVDIIEGDFEKYDFGNVLVDAALMSASLVHLPHDKLQPVLRNIAESVKPGGVLYISVKEGRGKTTDSENRDFYLWEKKDLVRIIEQLQFETIKFERKKSPLGTGETFLAFILKTKKDHK